MKRIAALAVAIGLVSTVGCWQQKVDPGVVGVLVDYGQGTQAGEPKITVIPPGTYVNVNGFNQWLQRYPSGEQIMSMVHQEKEGKIIGDDSMPCTDRDGVRVSVDTTTRWQIDVNQLPALFLRHPKTNLTDADNDVNNDLAGLVVRPIVRSAIPDHCGAYSFQELLTSPEKRAEFEGRVTERVRQRMTESYFQLNALYVRDIIPNEAIKASMDARVKAQQEAQTASFGVEKSRNEANALREKAQGEADSIRIVSEQLGRSPGYVQYMNALKWDGKMPQFVGGSGSGGPGASILIPAPAPSN